MTQDPQRWLEDEATDAELRALLLAGRDELPTPEALDRLEARVLGAIGPGGGGPGPPAASGAAKLALGLASLSGVAAAVAIAVATLTSGPPGSAPPPLSIEDPGAEPALSESPELAADATLPDATLPDASLSDAALPDAAPPGAAASEAAHPRDTGLDELALVTTAQAALASSPARALALAEEHARRFPEGALAQEREVVAITALLRLRRARAATQRAARFRARWPTSAHLRRLDVLLAGE